jgi:hypothetical protein
LGGESGPPRLREPAIRGDEALQHRHDELGRLDRRSAFGQEAAVFGEIAMEHGGKLHRNLDGLVVGDGAEFQLGHDSSPVWFEYKSRVTIIRTGNPGRMVSVGATLS